MFGSEKKGKKREAAAAAAAAENNANGDKSDEKSDEKRSMGSMVKSLWKGGMDKGKIELAKGKEKMEAALGLGAKPNVIPPGHPDIHGELRPVYIGWHPVAGMAGTWFAEKTGLGKKITEKIHSYPDPTQHWAIIVQDYVHQLWMDEQFHVIYINEKADDQAWTKWEVGKTRFNDEALRQAAEMTIFNMRSKKPAYNLISNNCQNFAVLLLEAIQAGARREFATTYAIYKRAIGEGTVAELFEVSPEEEEADAALMMAQGGGAVQQAQQVMEENTTKLDTHTPGRLHCC